MALTPEQRRVLAEIKAAPSYKRATPKVRKALIEAALVESNLSTPDQAHSDRDSEGVLQQRPSTGWGPTSESNTTDAEQFLRRAIPLRNKYGSAGALAQAVQRSAFPGRYNQRGAMASALLGGGGGGGRRALVRGSRSSGGRPASTRTTIETTPGVDNRVARAALVQSFLEDDNSDVLDFAVQAKALADVPATSTRRTVRTPGVPATAGRAASSGGGSGRISGSAHSPVGRAGKVIGTPHTGTHTLGNWQSDNAVDISVPVGTPMVALQDGVVVKVRRHPQGAGRFAGDQITIRGANGNEYFYAHGVARVKPGQRVRKGQKLGTTGSANGVPHLHFGQQRGDPRQHT